MPEIIFSYSSHHGVPWSVRASAIISGSFWSLKLLIFAVAREFCENLASRKAFPGLEASSYTTTRIHVSTMWRRESGNGVFLFSAPRPAIYVSTAGLFDGPPPKRKAEECLWEAIPTG